MPKLPEEQRLALLLVGMEGMRYEEASAVLGGPVGTIRSRLSRGREALRQLMSMGIEPDQFDPDAGAGDCWHRIHPKSQFAASRARGLDARALDRLP